MTQRRAIFVAHNPPAGATGHWVDLSGEAAVAATQTSDGGAPHLVVIDIPNLPGESRERWKKSFIDWLGEINIRNAGTGWWAYTASAKNVLSSHLGDQIIQTLALCEIAGQENFETLYIGGATPAQIEVFQTWAQGRNDLTVEIADTAGRPWFALAGTIGRLLFQFLRAWLSFALPSRGISAPAPCDVLLFTYVDGKLTDHADRYFGRLAPLLAEQAPGTRVAYAAYVYAPYRKALRDIASVSGTRYFPIFNELAFRDLVWALAQSLKALHTSRYDLTSAQMLGVSFAPVLRDALSRDVTFGSYFHNLLVYRCIPRMAAKTRPGIFVYPYENKSLEKLLLLALRRYSGDLHIIGYQHTSITPRHTTLLFAPGEAARTPLPDRIITAGEITRQYLERHGNYPAEIFRTGCAMRQTWLDAKPWNPVGDRPPRVLLALSSSRLELLQAVAFFLRLHEAGARFELGIRPHINFPLHLLPRNLRQWSAVHARDFSGTPLTDNIAWCDLTAYVSSTVALESLMAGKPAVNFRVADTLDPDPVLGDPALHWRTDDADGFAKALDSIRALTADRQRELAADAAAYVRSYLTPPCDECIRLFMGPPAPAPAMHRMTNAGATTRNGETGTA